MALTTLHRRRLLTAVGTASTTALAGCGGVLNQIADQLLEDVNVLNETDRQVSGQIQVSVDDERLLDSEFTIDAAEGENDNANIGTYADIWDGAGSYAAKVVLEEPIDGRASHSETVTIDDPDEEMLLVGLGLADANRPIVFRVGTSFTEIAER